MLVFLPLRAMQLFPLFLLFVPRLAIYFPPQKFLLAQKLPPVFEPRRLHCSCVQCRLYRASRLPFMTAITESALRR